MLSVLLLVPLLGRTESMKMALVKRMMLSNDHAIRGYWIANAASMLEPGPIPAGNTFFNAFPYWMILSWVSKNTW